MYKLKLLHRGPAAEPVGPAGPGGGVRFAGMAAPEEVRGAVHL